TMLGCLPMRSGASCDTLECIAGYHISGTLLCQNGPHFTRQPSCIPNTQCTAAPPAASLAAAGIDSIDTCNLPTVVGAGCSTFVCMSGLSPVGSLLCKVDGTFKLPLCLDLSTAPCIGLPAALAAE